MKATARLLGYRIDPLVSALMQIRRGARAASRVTLAFLSWNHTSRREAFPSLDYYPGAARRAREFGFRLERFSWAEPSIGARDLSDRLSLQRVRGVLVDRAPAGARLPQLGWDRFSCVAFGVNPATPALHHVAENHFDAVCEAMERCRERGYRRVGLVRASLPERSLLVDRALGAYTLQQLRFAPEAPMPVCPGYPATAAGFCAWFSSHRPDALLVDNPALVQRWLRQLGRRAPDDVGMACLQPNRSAGCTGFYCSPAATGALAIEMLLGLMHRQETGIPAVAHEILVTGEWREGGTLPPRIAAQTTGRCVASARRELRA